MLFLQNLFTFAFASLLVKSIVPVLAAHNVTVSNTDPSIQYSNHDWEFDGDYKSGATDHFAQITGAKASFQFTGVAIYYSVHLYPVNYSAGATLSLDGNPGETVQLSDPNARHFAANSTIVWSKTGLANTTHTLTAQILPNVDYITLDTILYTMLDPSDADSFATSVSSSTPSSSSTPDSESSSTSSGSSKEKIIAIALGVVLGTVLVGAIVGLLLCRRRKKARLPVSSSSKGVIVTLSSNTSFTTPLASDETKAPLQIAESDIVIPNQSSAASIQNGYRFLPEVEGTDAGAAFNVSRTTGFPPFKANFSSLNAAQRTPPIQVYPVSVGSNWQAFNHPVPSGGPNHAVHLRNGSESDRTSTIAVTEKTRPPTYISQS